MYLNKLQYLPKEKEKIILQNGYELVTPEKKRVFDPYFDKMNEPWSSPMSFMAMIAWRTSLTFYYKVLGNYIACLGWDATDGTMTMLPFIGHYENKAIAEAFELLKADCDRMGYRIHFTDMREWMRPYYDAIDGTNWEKHVTEDMNDYVYSGYSFENFSGKSGQYLRYFKRTYNYEVSEIGSGDLDVLLEFIRGIWCSKTDCGYCNYGCQVDCIENVVPNIETLGGFGIIVRIDGEIAGFCLGSKCSVVALIHFQNTKPEIKGIGMFMYEECRKRFLQDVNEISLGEDMGVPGIRTYKSRLAPHKWIPRFVYDLV
ncbi:phosphatidylglycerol lysyltransferase domain-containing protein [Pseudobutyrivibrio sp.]|uniref:phosphatidylglycerol lysyltransferase domain-containing protein n=1 Tax=Pseudobutyrivibrio sp. TaxID=2014367 RepID=UPI001B5EC64A|nr:phosphatidylglycerol lysyltransferase domain-containing protein [Pseudobutyrivibrio sp.]MBP3261246.1 DUF2156 domain-containing protein [Pseudobutyrivibrio sp.]